MRLNPHRIWIPMLFLLLAPSVTNAQQREQTDSLKAEVRRLKSRLDSLERSLNRILKGRADTAAKKDPLAALRAAARARVKRTDTLAQKPEERKFVARGRNLSKLNPEISATGDVRLRGNRPGPQEDNVDVREFEFSFQSALDPYSNTKVFFTFEDGQVDIEEGYIYWTGLPGGFRVDLGRYRQQIGELNRWHLHALPESEYPLVLSEYFGEEGLIGDGVSVYWIAPFRSIGGATHEVWGQVSLGNNEVLFDEGRRLSVLGHVNNFWQLSPSTYFQLGGTAVYGENPDQDLETSVFGGDFRLTWMPPEKALYRSFTIRGEAYGVKRKIGGLGDRAWGTYVSSDYQISRRIFAGARFDYVEAVDDPGRHTWAIVPRVKWWQSEWVYLRAEWQHFSRPGVLTGRDTDDKFLIQAVWAMGPHKHETY